MTDLTAAAKAAAVVQMGGLFLNILGAFLLGRSVVRHLPLLMVPVVLLKSLLPKRFQHDANLAAALTGDTIATGDLLRGLAYVEVGLFVQCLGFAILIYCDW